MTGDVSKHRRMMMSTTTTKTSSCVVWGIMLVAAVMAPSPLDAFAGFQSCAPVRLLQQQQKQQHSSVEEQRPTFLVRPNEAQRRQGLAPLGRLMSSSARTTLRLVSGGGGKAEMEEFLKEQDFRANPISKTVRGVSPKLLKIVGLAAVPLSGIVGFAMTPTRHLAAHTIGSAITGVAGYIGKSRLDVATIDAAKPALAKLLLRENFMDDPEAVAEMVEDLKDDFGVDDDEEWEAMLRDVYARYFMGMLKDPTVKTAELTEMKKLRTALGGLSNLAVGEAHVMAACGLYRHITSMTDPDEIRDDPDHPDRMSMDKCLFLSERTYQAGNETDQAFKYEMSRVAKAFNITVSDAMDRVVAVSEPFYRRALASTRSKLNDGVVSSDMLSRARATLGISDFSAQSMHVETFAEEVRSLLGTDEQDEYSDDEDEEEDQDGEGGEKTAKKDIDYARVNFPEGAMERLETLREILSLTKEDADYEIEAETTPLFQKATLTAMEDVIAGIMTPAKTWEVISQRQSELCLKENTAQQLLTSLIMQALGKPLEETLTFAKVNNEAATYDKLLDALAAKEAARSVLQESGWTDDVAENEETFMEVFFDPNNRESACGFMALDNRLKLYRTFLIRSVRKSESGKALTDELFAKALQVKTMLGISEEDADDVLRQAFGPELQKTLQMASLEILGDNYTPTLVDNLREMIDKVITDYRLQPTMVKRYAAPLYARAVSTVSDKSPGGVPADQEIQVLGILRELLLLSEEDAYAAHLDVFGANYKKAVVESMGGTGVIDAEVRPQLDDLRHRLGISEEASRRLFLEAVKEKMVPMIEFLQTELERTMLTAQQLARKRGKDFGEDYFKSGQGAEGTLGLGAENTIMIDMMNLVDFYTENGIIEKKQIGTTSVEEKTTGEDGEEKVTTKEVPVFETTYPITALQAKAVEPEIAELMYRQFVVGGFTTQGPQGTRYEGAKATFGGILGLTSEKMSEIGGNIGSTVYDNYIINAMKTKGSLDQQDMMFLANIQSKLGMSSEESEKLLMASQKKVLSEEAETLLDAPDVPPEAIKAFREKCNSMGLELDADVGISKARLNKMFELEVLPALESGEITAEDGDVLTEIHESLGLTAEECEKVLESLLQRWAQAAVDRITAGMLRGLEAKSVEDVSTLVRFAAFVDGELGVEVPQEVGYKIYNLYEAVDFSDEERETLPEKLELLKTTLGLP